MLGWKVWKVWILVNTLIWLQPQRLPHLKGSVNNLANQFCIPQWHERSDTDTHCQVHTHSNHALPIISLTHPISCLQCTNCRNMILNFPSGKIFEAETSVYTISVAKSSASHSFCWKKMRETSKGYRRSAITESFPMSIPWRTPSVLYMLEKKRK